MKEAVGGPAWERRSETAQSGERLRPPRPEEASKPGTLAERLRSERGRSFVGRALQLDLFREVLDDPTCTVLFVSGQVGVGKTALLEQLDAIAQSRGHATVLVDAGALASQADVQGRLAEALVEGSRAVLLIDAFERLGEAEDWFLRKFLPSLPSDLLLVLASRSSPPTALSLDPAWARLMRRVDVEPLDAADSLRLLDVLGAPADARAAIQGLAVGYPLALAVAAECARHSPESSFNLGELQDVQHMLERLLCPQKLSSDQQFALDVCSVARITTAELLDHLRVVLKQLDGVDTRGAFDWLSQQSFIDSTPTGLVPHTLVRVAAHARLRRERPRLHRLMAQAIREFFVTEMETGSNGQVDYLNLIFLDREIPFTPDWIPLVVAGAPQPLRWATVADHAALLELIREQEGARSAEVARNSLLLDLGRFEVAGTSRIERLTHSIRLSPDEIGILAGDDPTYAIIRRCIMQRPLAPEGEALIFRWWMDREAGQTPSARVLPILARQTQSTLRSKQAVRSFCVYRNALEWHRIYDNAHLPWQNIGSFRLDGHEFGVIEFDWSRRPLRDVLLSSWDTAERRFLPWGPLDQDAAEVSVTSRSPTLDELRINVRDRVTQLSRVFKLTPREAEILEQLCLGETPEAIGHRLAIRPRTVKFHQENLLRKAGVGSRAELFRKLL